MRYEIEVPNLDGVDRMQLVKTFVQVGEQLRQGDRLCELHTDMASFELVSEHDGVLVSLPFNNGDWLLPGDLFCVLEAKEELPEGVEGIQKWEYKHVKLQYGYVSGSGGLPEMDEIFNELGAAGWELVTINTIPVTKSTLEQTIAIFKRPI